MAIWRSHAGFSLAECAAGMAQPLLCFPRRGLALSPPRGEGTELLSLLDASVAAAWAEPGILLRISI
jgi:hypothetical protein